MEKLILDRDQTSDDGTFGRLLRANYCIADSVELPWRDNAHDTSCIPKGNYLVTRYCSPSKGNVFLLNAVPSRNMIEGHIANTIFDLNGCIGFGNGRGMLVPNGQSRLYPAVLHSTDTMERLLLDLPRSFYLQITGVCG